LCPLQSGWVSGDWRDKVLQKIGGLTVKYRALSETGAIRGDLYSKRGGEIEGFDSIMFANGLRFSRR